jgi:hypothetical protein
MLFLENMETTRRLWTKVRSSRGCLGENEGELEDFTEKAETEGGLLDREMWTNSGYSYIICKKSNRTRWQWKDIVHVYSPCVQLIAARIHTLVRGNPALPLYNLTTVHIIVVLRSFILIIIPLVLVYRVLYCHTFSQSHPVHVWWQLSSDLL